MNEKNTEYLLKILMLVFFLGLVLIGLLTHKLFTLWAK